MSTAPRSTVNASPSDHCFVVADSDNQVYFAVPDFAGLLEFLGALDCDFDDTTPAGVAFTIAVTADSTLRSLFARGYSLSAVPRSEIPIHLVANPTPPPVFP